MLRNADSFALVAEAYAQCRPGYPNDILGVIAATCGLEQGWVIADIGCGTGNLAKLFLARGHRVIGVEPNREMREAGARMLSMYPVFTCLDGCAEDIPLDTQSVDLVTIGQALPWFDTGRSKAEIERILRGDKWVAVVWNDRLSGATEFTTAYDRLTRAHLSTNPFHDAPMGSLSDDLDRLFDGRPASRASFPHKQIFDLAGLLGRARSSGFIESPDDTARSSLAADLTDLFDRYQHDGTVVFHYLAQLRVGRIRT